MDKTSQNTTSKSVFHPDGRFQCYGFGFNGFRQITAKAINANESQEVDFETGGSHPASVLTPVQLNFDCVSSILASWSSTFYLKENGTINKVGWNSKTKMFGEEENLLPDHFVTDACCSWTQLVFLTKDGDCLQWTDYTRFNEESKPVKVCSNGTKFKEVGCRESSCILVTGNGQAGVVCNDQVKDGAVAKPVPVFKAIAIDKEITSVACGKEHALLLTSSGTVYTLGSGSRGQLGRGLIVEEQSSEVVPALEGIRMLFIAAGDWHSAAISEFGDLYMWGWNEKGQLGLAVNPNDTLSSSGGQVQCQTVPVPVSFPDDLEVLMVSCGSRHTAAVLGDGSVWTWGWVPDIRGKNGSEPRKVIKVNSGKNKRLPCWIKIIDPNQTLKYYWLKDNQTLSGGHQRTVRRSQFVIRYLRIRKAKKEDAGFYTCVVVSDCGESNHTIQLIVKEAKTCKANQFTCADKSCISLFWKCDGRHDCHDRSDENGCPTTAPLVCSKEMFRCDGDCIQGHLQCDGKNDCADGSDERGCAAPQLRRSSPPRLVEQMRQKEVKLICNIQQLHLQMF